MRCDVAIQLAAWTADGSCICTRMLADGEYINSGIFHMFFDFLHHHTTIAPVYSKHSTVSKKFPSITRYFPPSPEIHTQSLIQSVNMRTAAIIAVVSAMVSTVVAAPAPIAAPEAAPGNWKPKGSWGWGHAGAWHKNKGKGKGDQCLSDEDAIAVAGVFQQLIQGYTLELTEEALTEDFVDWSSAVNIIRNRGGEGPNVVNAVTFTSREEFSANHGKQPNIPFETLNVFHGCNSTSVRWQTLRSGNGQPKEQAAIVSHS